MNLKETIKTIKNMNKKKKTVIALSTAGILILGSIGIYSLSKNDDKLILTKSSISAELGEIVSTDVADYINYDKTDKDVANDIIKKTKSSNNFKYVTVETKDENGNVISKEQKEYPKVGKYKINFSYESEKKSVDVKVSDTTKPKITAPDTIDVIQFTDLSTFNFTELLKAEDYSDLEDWQIDTSKVDVNTLGTYDLKISISDVEKNKANKDMKINIVESPVLAEGEVAVTEIVTDPATGQKKTVVTKKSSSAVSVNDNVTTGKPVENTDKVQSGSGGSATKPSNPSGSTGGNTGSGNTGGSNSGNKPSHSHSWEAVTKIVHHEAETKVIHHDAVTKKETVTVVDKPAWDEPIYESRVICNKCGFSTTNEDEIMIHCMEVCNGRWHVGKVQIDTIHHEAITHQEEKTIVVTPAWDETVVVKPAWDETVITGYKCSCGATK